MATAQSKKRLALAIVDFLQKSSTDGTVAPDDAEQLEVAANCIAEAFKVDLEDKAAMTDALGGQSLISIYNVYEKLKGKTTAATQGSSSASEARPATPQSAAKAEGVPNKSEGERLKGLGNEAMKRKDYEAAINHYTAALEAVPLNPIYLSNRAAAFSGLGKHEEAKEDAEMATAADPNYSKAWSRLGLAKFVLGDSKGAMEAYKSGMEVEGGGASEVMKKGYETAKKRYEEEGGDVGAPDAARGAGGGAGGMPDLSSLASMFGGSGGGGGGGGMPDLSALAGMMGGGGGGGGGGGMPDIAAMMQNPMMRQMAQNVMQNPDMLRNIMSNPQVARMAEQFGGGRGGGQGGGPSIADMMNDPSIAEMARNFMGGAGRGGAGGAPPS